MEALWVGGETSRGGAVGKVVPSPIGSSGDACCDMARGGVALAQLDPD